MALAKWSQLVALAEVGCWTHLGCCTHLGWGSQLGCCCRQSPASAHSPLIWQQPGPGCGEAVGSLSTEPGLVQNSLGPVTPPGWHSGAIAEEHLSCRQPSTWVFWGFQKHIPGGVWAKQWGGWRWKPRWGLRQCTGTPVLSQPPVQHRDLLCTTFLGKIMKVHYVWRQNGWRSGQECWVSKSCRLDER